MIRSKKLQHSSLDKWLVSVPLPGAPKGYSLSLWQEDRGALVGSFRDEVIGYFDEAFEDARASIRKGFADDLGPFKPGSTDPAANFPKLLHRITQQGHLGEMLGVLAVEHWGAAGQTDWKVPAMLFRFHTVELQHLESINERIEAGQSFDQDEEAEMRPGRTGDDALAFRMNDAGEITDVLTIEAKCVKSNNLGSVNEAHAKLSTTLTRNSGFKELINILSNYDTSDAKRWRAALLHLWKESHKTVRRYDCVSYAVGAIPKKPKDRKSWLNPLMPHHTYTAKRNLVAFEFHFPDLSSAIDAIYRS